MSSPNIPPIDDDEDDILSDIHNNSQFPGHSSRPGVLRNLNTFALIEAGSGHLLRRDEVGNFLEGPPDTTYNPGQAWSDQGGDSRDGSRRGYVQVTDQGFPICQPEEDPDWLETDDKTRMIQIEEEDKQYLTVPSVSIVGLGYPTIEAYKGNRSMAESAGEGDDFDREMEKFTDRGFVLPDGSIPYGLQAQQAFFDGSRKLHDEGKTVVFFPNEQYSSEW